MQQRRTDTNLVYRALLLTGLILFAVYVVTDRGLMGAALGSDPSGITIVILVTYAAASLHWLWLARSLGSERRRFAELESLFEEAEVDAQDLARIDAGLLGAFLRNWRAKDPGGDPGPLLTAFGDELVNRHAFGHFASDALLKLGLLGTIVGFIMMLIPVAEAGDFESGLMQQLLAAMSGGMSVALYTTLAGLVTSTLLKLQYHVLDASAADLATRLAVLTDVHLSRHAA